MATLQDILSGNFPAAQRYAEGYAQMPSYLQDPYLGLSTSQVGNVTKGLLSKTQFEKAQEIASKNAETLLGLPKGNTAMDRAKAMGYNISEPMYHGSKNANQTFFTPSSGGELGAGTYVTNNPDLASEFARYSYGGVYPEQSGVYKVFTKNLEQLPREDWLNIRAKEMDRLRTANQGEWLGEFYDKSMKNMRANTEKSNLAGWYTPTIDNLGGANQGVVFEPKNIRSVNAAFDPARANEPDLLAATLAIPVSGLLEQPKDKKKKK